jgi:hypothetical protein
VTNDIAELRAAAERLANAPRHRDDVNLLRQATRLLDVMETGGSKPRFVPASWTVETAAHVLCSIIERRLAD